MELVPLTAKPLQLVPLTVQLLHLHKRVLLLLDRREQLLFLVAQPLHLRLRGQLGTLNGAKR